MTQKTQKYSVRIGRKANTVYVRTPKGSILRFIGKLPSRDSAKRIGNQVRRRLARGGKLDPKLWTVVKRNALVGGPQAI